MRMRVVRVVVVDDHALFRRGLIELLRDMPEIQVVGEAANGQEALEVVRRTGPDVVLLDITMPSLDGLRTLEALRKWASSPKVLMLTVSQQEADLMQAIRSGADGYLLKNVEPEELRKAILRVYQGEGALSPEVTAPVLRALAYQSEMANRQILSDRELEVLECLAEGKTTGQIAAKLYISDNTVKTHVRHILEKLEASNRTEAVSKAIALGLIRRHEP